MSKEDKGAINLVYILSADQEKSKANDDTLFLFNTYCECLDVSRFGSYRPFVYFHYDAHVLFDSWRGTGAKGMKSHDAKRSPLGKPTQAQRNTYKALASLKVSSINRELSFRASISPLSNS